MITDEFLTLTGYVGVEIFAFLKRSNLLKSKFLKNFTPKRPVKAPDDDSPQLNVLADKERSRVREIQ